jgi:phosphatidylglycerophosphate synthase
MIKEMANVQFTAMAKTQDMAGKLAHPAVRAQAALVLALLIPAAAAGSFLLARTAQATVPVLAAVVTAAICVVGGAIIWSGLRMVFFPHDRLGLCNMITMARGAGIAVLAGLAVTPSALEALPWISWLLVAVAALTLGLDGVDGWAARRSGLGSRFGARLDVETDVAFAIVVALLAWQSDKVGAWFLLLGALRPAYLLAGMIWPALQAPLPPAFWRKFMAAMQMTIQVALLAPVIVAPVSTLLGLVLLAAMAASFAVDILGQFRRAHAQQPTNRQGTTG